MTSDNYLLLLCFQSDVVNIYDRWNDGFSRSTLIKPWGQTCFVGASCHYSNGQTTSTGSYWPIGRTRHTVRKPSFAQRENNQTPINNEGVCHGIHSI